MYMYYSYLFSYTGTVIVHLFYDIPHAFKLNLCVIEYIYVHIL